MNRFRYLLGCHCLVALYISNDCFSTWMTAKHSNATLRTNCRILFRKIDGNETLLDEEVQMVKSVTWIVTTGRKGKN